LTYTTFEYGEPRLSADEMTEERPLTVSVRVTNTGPLLGEEVVQLYIRDLAGDVVRPLKELKDFRKISLQPGESAEVAFTVSEPQLRYYHSDLTYASDAGEFRVYVGPNSRDAAELRFRLTKKSRNG
jgi:beta-glucosidase